MQAASTGEAEVIIDVPVDKKTTEKLQQALRLAADVHDRAEKELEELQILAREYAQKVGQSLGYQGWSVTRLSRWRFNRLETKTTGLAGRLECEWRKAFGFLRMRELEGPQFLAFDHPHVMAFENPDSRHF